MVAPVIVVNELRKAYGTTVAVDGISFEVEQGEFFGILGPNGAGKTTTLEVLEGLRQPDSGVLSVFGLPPWPRNPALLPVSACSFSRPRSLSALPHGSRFARSPRSTACPARRATRWSALAALPGQA